MFATRDQENLVHARQTTAAGKPLNQSIRSLHPKTPANHKTPFRPQNDENQSVAFQGRKTGFKGEGSKLDRNEFITPAATRSRAPLGAKTTNAKAQPLKTPGVGHTTKQDKTSKKASNTHRSARKITVAPSDPVVVPIAQDDIDEDEPDFGYAPPPIKELPDPPIDFGYDQDFPQFRPENMFKGYGEIYFGSPKDEAGFSLRLKQEREQDEIYLLEQERKLTESIAKQQLNRFDPDAEVDKMIAAGPKSKSKLKESNPTTIRAKTAASALAANVPGTRTLPGASKPTFTKSTQVRARAPLTVSKNTIGFPKAKQAPSILPKSHRTRADQPQQQPKINQNDIHPLEFVRLYGEPPIESEMWLRLKQHELLQQDSQDLFGADDGLAADLDDLDLFAPTLDDGDDLFQLPVPEG